jgi:hypothetical protein
VHGATGLSLQACGLGAESLEDRQHQAHTDQIIPCLLGWFLREPRSRVMSDCNEAASLGALVLARAVGDFDRQVTDVHIGPRLA